jgi:hypothetical protein
MFLLNSKFIPKKLGQNSKFFLPLLFFFLPLFFNSCASDWRVYDGSEFSIEFPGLAQDTATIEGKFAGGRTFYEPVQGSLDSNLYYAVSMYTLPDSLSVLGDNLDDFLKTDVNIYAWTIGGTLSDSGRVVKSGNVEGREYKVLLQSNKGVSTVRKFAYGKHLYTLLVVTENMKLDNAEIEKFMNSFKLKSPPVKK